MYHLSYSAIQQKLTQHCKSTILYFNKRNNILFKMNLYLGPYKWSLGLPRWLSGKESTCQCRRSRRWGFNPWVGKIPWRREWQPTPVFLPGKSNGQRSLAEWSPQSCKESDMTEQLSTRFLTFYSNCGEDRDKETERSASRLMVLSILKKGKSVIDT